MLRRLLVVAYVLVGLPLVTIAQDLRLPNQNRSVKFAVIGDSGRARRGAERDRKTDGCVAHPIPV